MYELKTLHTVSFIVIALLMAVFFVLALLKDNKHQKEIQDEIERREEEIYYECMRESKRSNTGMTECLRHMNAEETRTRDILELNAKNESITKGMINSSLEGAIRGGIFGYIIAKCEGAFVGIILFATLNPLMKYLQTTCRVQSYLI